MGNYLKLSDETRRIEQKVQKLHNKRLGLIIEVYKKNYTNLFDLVKRKDNVIDSLKFQVNELENKIKDFQFQIKAKISELQNLENMIEGKDKVIVEQSKTIEQQLQTIDSHINIQNTHLSLSAGSKAQEQELKSVKKELKKQHALEIRQLKEKHSDELEKVNCQYKDLLNENIKLKEDIHSLTNLKVEKKTDKNFESKRILEKLDEYKNIFTSKRQDNLDKKTFENTNVLIHDLGEVFKEIGKISNIIDDVKNYNKDILDKVKFESKSDSGPTRSDELTKYNNTLLENTIFTLKETIRIKDDIIKNQNKLMKDRKVVKNDVLEDSSSDIIIKPEDQNRIVFDTEEVEKEKKTKNRRPYKKKKKETISNQNKNIEKKDETLFKDERKTEEKDKKYLPKDLPKNNTSFFANLTFTDSSPLTKKR